MLKLLSQWLPWKNRNPGEVPDFFQEIPFTCLWSPWDLRTDNLETALPFRLPAPSDCFELNNSNLDIRGCSPSVLFVLAFQNVFEKI